MIRFLCTQHTDYLVKLDVNTHNLANYLATPNGQPPPVSQNWQIWVENNTLWILFFHSFPLISLWIFHSYPLKMQ